jgi:hypothetical protein
MRWFRELARTGLVLGGVACSEPNGTDGLIGIQADPAVRNDGSFVLATIRNLSSDHLRYSTCSYRIEQPGPDGSWAVAYQAANPCPAILEFLKGYQTRQTEVSLPAELPAGSYRVRFPEIGRSEVPGLTSTAAQIGGEFSLRQ